MPLSSNEVPFIDAAQCVNHAQAQTVCRACSKSCCADAIEHRAEAAAVVDPERCTSCVACMEACPVGAIHLPDFSVSDLLKAVQAARRRGESTLHVACAEVASAVQGESVARIPCHALWTAPLFAELAALGLHEVSVMGVEQCASCSRRFGRRMLDETLQQLRGLERSVGVKIQVSEGTLDSVTSEQPARADANLPPRRAFFRNLLPELTRGAATLVSEIARHADEEREPDAAWSRSPLQRLMSLLPAMKPNFTPLPPMRGLPVGAVQGSERCVGHGRCVDQCPTQALSLRPFGERAVLELQASRCVGCSRCVHVCPEHALEMLPSISLPALLSKPARPLAMPSTIANPSSSTI